MLAIARVNNVFKDKEGGLIVDYLYIAQDLRKALNIYTTSGGKGKIEFGQAEAVAKMEELYVIVVELFDTPATKAPTSGAFIYKRFFGLTTREKMSFMLDATNFVLALDKEQERFSRHGNNLCKAFALSVSHPQALAIRDDLSFFQAIKARISKIRESIKSEAMKK